MRPLTRTLLLATLVCGTAAAQQLSCTGTATAATDVIVTAGFSPPDSRPAGTNLSGGLSLYTSYQQTPFYVTAGADFTLNHANGAVTYSIHEAVSGTVLTRRAGPHETVLRLTPNVFQTGTLSITYSTAGSATAVAEVDIGNDGSFDWTSAQGTFTEELLLNGPLELRTRTSQSQSSHTLTIAYTPLDYPPPPMTNGGFEDGLLGWTAAGSALVASGGSHSGNKHLELRAGAFPTFPGVVEQNFWAGGSKGYRLSCWALQPGAEPLVGGSVRMQLEFLGSTGVLLASSSLDVVLDASPTDVWTEAPPLIAVAPPGTARAVVSFTNQAQSGAGWIDAVTFERVTANVGTIDQADCATTGSTPRSWTFTPDASNPVLSRTLGPSLFDPNIGPSLNVTSDDAKVEDIDIGFPFWWSSSASSLIDIDPNGRVLPGNSTDDGDYTPTIAEHVANQAIAVFWNDFNVLEPGSGNIHLNVDPGVSATITWNDVKQYGVPAAAGGLTVQLKLFADGSFVITHEDIREFNAHDRGEYLLIGFSSHNGADYGESDFTALPGLVTWVTYEWWDSWFGPGGTPVETPDLIELLPADYDGVLEVYSDPVLGGTWMMSLNDYYLSAQLGFYLAGFEPANVDLAPLGSPCRLLVDPVEIVPAFYPIFSGFNLYQIAIPNDASLTGVKLYVQGALEGAPASAFSGFAGTPFRLSFTNAVVGTIGPP